MAEKLVSLGGNPYFCTRFGLRELLQRLCV